MTEITKFDDYIFETDCISDHFLNAVFPIFEDESIYFARNLLVRPNDKVLDIGTGSGVLAIAAAKRGAKVTACDINPRAIEFARKNALKNGVDNIDYVLSNVFASIKDKFDIILVNPPFNPMPPNKDGKLSSAAGYNGLSIIKEIFSNCKSYLNPYGTIQIISFSLGTNGKPLIFDSINEYLGELSPQVTYTHLYPVETQKNTQYFKRIFGKNVDKKWLAEMHKFPELYYMFINIETNAQQPGFYERPLQNDFEIQEFSGNREARIRRLQSMLNLSP